MDKNINIQPAAPPDTIKHFVKVPKEVILNKDISEHRLSVLLYLVYNQTWDECVHYSPLYMLQWSGYKPNWDRHNKNNIYVKFKNCMEWYFKNGYIVDFDETKFVQSTFQSSLLNKENINPYNNFGILYDFEIEAINNYKSPYKPLNNSMLLLLLSYIRAFSWVRSNENTGHSNNSKKEKPEIFHSQFLIIEQFTGISRKLVSRATDILESLGLIETYRMPKYKDDNGKWHTDDIIYVCPYKYVSKNGQIRKCSQNEYNYKKELEYGIEFVERKNIYKKSFIKIDFLH